jgi:hypothetical protein
MLQLIVSIYQLSGIDIWSWYINIIRSNWVRFLIKMRQHSDQSSSVLWSSRLNSLINLHQHFYQYKSFFWWRCFNICNMLYYHFDQFVSTFCSICISIFIKLMSFFWSIYVIWIYVAINLCNYFNQVGSIIWSSCIYV